MRSHLPAMLMATLLAASCAQAATLAPEQRFRTLGAFAGKKPGKPARDVSGLACMPVANGAQRCLLINDEGAFAQFARIAENRITPGASLPIIGAEASPETLGQPPQGICKAPGRFAELDGEAVAYADGAFYLAGSHGCSRNKGEFRLSAFHLARIRVDAEGTPTGRVELSYRLSDMLRRAGEAGAFFGKSLMDDNGLNVEGIAVIGDTLWAGLRAPSLGNRSFLVGASLAALFAPGHAAATEAPKVIALPAGHDRGIRDLAPLPDGKLLALLGPAQEQPLPYSLILIDPARPEAAAALGELPSRGDGKAESLTVLGEGRGGLTVLIGYDGPKNGHFESYRLPLPARTR
ncbi:conserved exported hypothetical protein [Hyphomicrobiales bacterium]|nr:conserved exported hypothetical protein [Hyphomicrobiales bacterium]CAH1699510.1 conserved exported hypothetical protein [Hyphomicrobiales bacterium]CAI0343297.1 DUF3616 domain-containing protein [Hyphomicrobiales bacterium]